MSRQQDEKKPGKYDDIIHLSRPISKKHPPMSMADRAGQFSPFSALTGHSAAIRETARYTSEKPELDENKKAELDQVLSRLRHKLAQPHHDTCITVTWFIPDEKKAGGSLVVRTGMLIKIDIRTRSLILEEDLRIPVDDILEIEEE